MKKVVVILASLLLMCSCAGGQMADVNVGDIVKSVGCINKAVQCSIQADALMRSTEDDFVANWVKFQKCNESLFESQCLEQAQKLQSIVDAAMEKNE